MIDVYRIIELSLLEKCLDFDLMSYLHCRTRIQVPTRIRIPNPMATLYYAEHVHIAD